MVTLCHSQKFGIVGSKILFLVVLSAAVHKIWQWTVTICSGSKPEMATFLFLSTLNDKERSLSGSIFSSIFSCSGSFGDVGGSGAAGFACAACQAVPKRLFVSECWFWSPVEGHDEQQNRSWDSMVLIISAYKMKLSGISSTKSWNFIRRRMPYSS